MKPAAAALRLLDRLQRRIEGPALRGLMSLPVAVRRSVNGRPITRDGLMLDPDMQSVIRAQALLREPPMGVQDVSLSRTNLVRQAQIVAGHQPIGTVVDRRLTGSGGSIPIRVYTPRGLVGVGPGLVFLHGGSFVYGDLASHDGLCRFLAERAGLRIVSVDYRLAPEHVFPAAVDDALAAYDWIHTHAAELEIDPTRLAVGGDSAGGNLAATLARERRGDSGPCFQVLIYPSTRVQADTASMRLFADGFYLTRKAMDEAVAHYVPPGVDVADPRVSPLEADDLTGLCPAFVVTAGFDPLRDEGEAYADKLRSAGVEVELRRFEGMIHGFANMVGLGRSAPAAVDEIAATLSRRLARSGPSTRQA